MTQPASSLTDRSSGYTTLPATTGHGTASASDASIDAHPLPGAYPPLQTTGLPLNAFQRVLRMWELVHPYNAAQVMELRRPVDARAASVAWGQTLEELGLGRVEEVRWGYRHVGLNGEMSRYPVKELPAGSALEPFLSAELNRRFDDSNEPPFRPFLVPNSTGDGCQFGVVYQHWVADSVAVRQVLRRWLFRMFAPDRLGPPRIRHADEGYIALAAQTPGEESAGQTVLSLLRRHLRYRRARKPATLGDNDYAVAVVMEESRGLVPKLIAAAHDKSARVNDLFLAAATRACDTRIPVQKRRNRPDLAVASIVDLRPLAGGRLDDRFGLFLGFAEVVCTPGEIADRASLVSSVARQNRLIRRRGIWPSSMGWMIAALALRPLIRPSKLYAFVRKETPTVAGVSNVNLNRTWIADEASEWVKSYRRVSPTGPMAPVVFSVTSLGDDLHLSLTYRSNLLNEAQARELAGAFFEELKALCV